MPHPAYTVISHLYRKSCLCVKEGIGINPEATEKTLRFQGKLRPRGLDFILWEMTFGTRDGSGTRGSPVLLARGSVVSEFYHQKQDRSSFSCHLQFCKDHSLHTRQMSRQLNLWRRCGVSSPAWPQCVHSQSSRYSTLAHRPEENSTALMPGDHLLQQTDKGKGRDRDSVQSQPFWHCPNT